jgi:hypothetical protein
MAFFQPKAITRRSVATSRGSGTSHWHVLSSATGGTEGTLRPDLMELVMDALQSVDHGPEQPEQQAIEDQRPQTDDKTHEL